MAIFPHLMGGKHGLTFEEKKPWPHRVLKSIEKLHVLLTHPFFKV